MSNTRRRSARFTLTVDLESAAFDLPFYGPELARILTEEVAEAVAGGRYNVSGTARDHNGNTVATYTVSGVPREGAE